MYAPHTEVVDPVGNRVAIGFVVRGRALLCRKDRRLGSTEATALGVWHDPLSVVLVTAYGRRLKVAGSHRVMVQGPHGSLWKRAKDIRVGTLVYAADGGILTTDRVTCVVQADGDGEPWITVTTGNGTLFAEEILCRAN